MTLAPPLDDDRRMAATVTAMMVVIAVVMTIMKGNSLLGDPDTQWHIATGRLIWETGQMPRIDTMSHTYAGQPWIAKEWLSQMLLFAAHALGGWLGILLLGAACLGLTALIIARSLLRTAGPIAASLICWISITTLLVIATPRPHVIALPVMALFTVMLLDASEDDQSPPWLALPVMMLWANLHAAFTLGLIIAAFIGLDALLRAAPERRLRLALLWAGFGVGLLAAACIHPYGVQSLLINIDMARGNESIPLIGEWDRHPLTGNASLRILVPAMLIATLAIGGWRNAARIGLGLFMLYLTWKHQRFVMMLAIVVPMMTRDSVVACFEAVFARFNIFRWPDPLRDPKWRAPMAVSCVAMGLAMPFAMEQTAIPQAAAPKAALESVPAALRAQPVYNAYNFGGFLVLERVPTFIDGRTDQLFTDNFMGRLYDHIRAKDQKAFLAFIEGRGARWAIVQTGFNDTEILQSAPGWRETYSDEHAKVFVRDGG